jgi:predicted DCC family thiol-disulfide oxidoreductase YuxK
MKVVLYDGVCHLCDGTVKFLLKHDKKEALHFAALQSEFTKSILKSHSLSVLETPETILFLDGENLYTHSEAVFQILKSLPAPWSWLHALSLLPASLTDFVYKIIAKNRYNWFGKEDQCLLPHPQWKERFLS